MEIIKINTPNAEQLARGTGVNMAFRFGMSNGKVLRASDVVGQEGNPKFNKEEYFGAIIQDKVTFKAIDINVSPPKHLEFTFHECLFTINRPKNIVTTAMQGRDGTIKEYVANDDYQITLEAGIDSYLGNEQSDKRFEYPAEQLEELIQILNFPNELEVTSDFLKLFKIYSVVVTQYNLTQETHTNRQSIQIQLLSDEPYIIKIKEEDK